MRVGGGDDREGGEREEEERRWIVESREEIAISFARFRQKRREKKRKEKKTLANETYSVERIGSLIFRNGRVSGNEIGQKHD